MRGRGPVLARPPPLRGRAAPTCMGHRPGLGVCWAAPAEAWWRLPHPCPGLHQAPGSNKVREPAGSALHTCWTAPPQPSSSPVPVGALPVQPGPCPGPPLRPGSALVELGVSAGRDRPGTGQGRKPHGGPQCPHPWALWSLTPLGPRPLSLQDPKTPFGVFLLTQLTPALRGRTRSPWGPSVAPKPCLHLRAST